MAKGRLITREIGNLRGFSTDSIFLRPPNVATQAINLQSAPDGTFQIRRGYQCQIAQIGGMGIGTFDDPTTDTIQTVCVGLDGFVYNKLQKQIYLNYDGQVTGNITGLTNANPGKVHSVGHGLINGTKVILRNVGGMVQVNNQTYTITVVDADNFTIGINTTAYTAYTSGGIWSIAFADGRYLTFSIYTDPLYIYATANQSISCNIIVNRAAQIVGNQTGTTLTVAFGHELAATDVVQFLDSSGVIQQKTITSVTSTSITFAGSVTVKDGAYVNQFFYILFGKGFDQVGPYTIQDFIDQITNVTTGIYGLQIAINGDSDLPAAFLQIVEPTIIDSNSQFILNYWYWDRINFTINPPLPGSASRTFQNSDDFENASIVAYDDVVYIANGIDFPQKYDGQTVYRTGMPQGIRVVQLTDYTTAGIPRPFSATNTYQYATTYEQVDARQHIVEGQISEVQDRTIGATPSAENVKVENLVSTVNNNWNTNGALALGGLSTVYGPDNNGFYYDLTTLNPGSTLNFGDNAYYGDLTCAVANGGQTGHTFNVDAGHGVVAGDTVYFTDSSGIARVRFISGVTAITISIEGSDVTILDDANFLVYLTSKVFGDVAIADSSIPGSNTNVNIITVYTAYPSGHSILLNDVVEFIDSSGNLQRRTVTNVNISGTAITVSGIPVSILDKTLIYSINLTPSEVNFQRSNANGATLSDGIAPHISNAISNNLRINIYRTLQGKKFGTNGDLYLIASIPNNSLSPTQTYIDTISDTELTQNREFDDPDESQDPPPVCKYLRAFGNQMFYAGGQRGNPENSDRVFFSEGNNPEIVPLATFSFNVPNVDDDVTGIGVAGTTLVVTKNHSLWAITGNFLSGNATVIQVAPGTNIGCVSYASIASVGTLMYFLHTNGVYAITENQLYPTDIYGNPVPLSLAIDAIFRETNFIPSMRYVLKRSVGLNYTKDKQYLLFLPCEDAQSTIRTANTNSIILCYDYEHKNWFQWNNMNAAGGMFVIEDDLYFQERRSSGVNGNTANLYKQHRFYRLVDHADHAGAQFSSWLSSWEDLEQPEVRKKFSHCILLMDRISSLLQFNNPIMTFSSYLNRIPNLKSTISTITTVDNIRNSSWSFSPWGWNYWSGYQDSFITVNLKQGTVAKSIQVGFDIQGINMDIRLAGFQIEAIPENRMTVVR